MSNTADHELPDASLVRKNAKVAANAADRRLFGAGPTMGSEAESSGARSTKQPQTPEQARILIVEDEQIVALELQDRVTQMGHSIAGVGLISNNAPSEGLRADVVGGSANIADGGVKAYEPAPAFLQLDLQFNPFSGPGQRHILFTRNENIYILPAGVTLVRRQPPTIASVTPGVDEKGRGIATLGGKGFLPTTRILFDGVPAEVFSVDEAGEFMMVAPPPGVPNHQAVVTALNSDGQSSLFVDALAVPAYHYDAAESPLVVLTPNSLPAGSEAMIEINGINTHFAEGQTVVGFGTSDIAVRRVWVITPTRLMANVRIAPAASPLPVNLTVMTGLEVVGQPGALLVQPENPLAIVANPELVNPVTGLPSVYAGGTAEVTLSNLPENAAVSIIHASQPHTGSHTKKASQPARSASEAKSAAVRASP